MGVSIVGGMLGAMGPDSQNGSAPPSEGRSYVTLARNGAVVALPIVLAGVAAAGARRRQAGQGTGAPAGRTGPLSIAARATGKTAPAKAKRYRPKNVVRYYGLSALIAALERDSTRKAIIATLKWMQKRS